ncbi:MAG: hypothetical protein ACRD2U_02690 [Terriglobales bacterium]
MKKVLCSTLSALIAVVIVMVSGAAFAQTTDYAATLAAAQAQVAASHTNAAPLAPTAPSTGEDAAEYFTTNYFANNTAAGAPDATLRYTMHYGAVLQTRTLCANIYVFAADQQPTECCACPITANGLVTASVKKNLTSNPLTGVIPADGVVQIVSSLVPSDGVCDPTVEGAIDTGGPNPEVDSWLTHIQNKVGTAFPITEGEGVEELLTGDEYADLVIDCAFVQEFGSGQGTCTCGTEK